jgi:type-F conjugative transfer system pilin assembly protein TrbC
MFLVCLFLLIFTQAFGVDYFNEGKRFTEDLLLKIPSHDEKELKKILSDVKSNHSNQTNQLLPLKDGKCGVECKTLTETSLYVFVSFSMPDDSWLSLSHEVDKVRGIFVLRGLPDDSFKKLAEKLYVLRKQGFNASVQVDPQLFQRFKIAKVPTFITIDEQGSDQLSGNVTLAFALEKMNNKTAQKLRSRL